MIQDTTDLQRRLLVSANSLDGIAPAKLARDAADALAAKDAEIDRLARALESAHTDGEAYAELSGKWQDCAVAAEAREANLREALVPFAKQADELEQCMKQQSDPRFRDPSGWSKSCSWDDLQRARTVLSDKRDIPTASALAAADAQADTVTVPREPTEAMWGGLARDIVTWWNMSDHTGAALYWRIDATGVEVPDWLHEEIPATEHVPPKGTVAACIYRAMIAAAQTGGGE